MDATVAPSSPDGLRSAGELAFEFPSPRVVRLWSYWLDVLTAKPHTVN